MRSEVWLRATLLFWLHACDTSPGALDATESDAPASDVGDEAADAPRDAAPLDAAPAVPTVARVYTAESDGQIVVHSLESDGHLTEIGRTAVRGGASFMAIDGSGRRGAAVLEGASEVVALAYAAGTGLVTEVGARRGSGSAGPTHVSLDGSGGWAFVANYGGGSVASFRVGADGSLGDAVGRQSPGANAHMIAATPSNRWVLVPCLGDDRVVVLGFDESSGALMRGTTYDAADGAGPRHFAITRDGTHVYVNNERNSTVDVLRFDEASGALTHLATASTLPSGFSMANTTAEILLGADERTLYVSNRGHDSIAIFHVGDDHLLMARGHAMLMARRPRSMALDPSGTWLLAAAQGDDVVVSFRVASDGSLTRTSTSPTSSSPTFVGIFSIPER